MNKYATSESRLRVLVWLVWFIVLLTAVDVNVVHPASPTTKPVFRTLKTE